MKNKLLILSIAGLCSFATVSAQQSWAIAPSLGMNFSTSRVAVDGKVSDDYGYRTAFSIGATAEYLYKPKIYFRPSVNLASSRGTQSAVYNEAITTTTDRESKITYFDLIADLKYAFGESEKIFAVGGLYYGFALSGTEVITTTKKGEKANENSETISFGSADDQRCGWDAGLGIGLGYRFNVSGKPLEVAAKYNFGLINQVNVDKVTMYNRYFTIAFCYYLFDTGTGSGKSGGSETKPTKKKGVTKDEEL